MNKYLSVLIGLSLVGIFVGCAGSDPDPTPAVMVEADFSVSDTIVSAGGSVSFSDLSSGNPTGWTWTFEGGDPASSTDQNPTVVYKSPGIYDVTLSASNEQGNNSKMLTDLVEVVCFLDSIENPGYTTEVFTLNSQNQLIKYNNLIGVVMEFHYDDDARLTKIARFGDDGVFWDTTTFEYNNHLITNSTLTTSTGFQVKGTYNYDTQERLDHFVFESGETINYTYDNIGNLTQFERVDLQGNTTVGGTYIHDDKINPWSFFKLPRIHYLPHFTNPNNEINVITGINSSEFTYDYNDLGLPASGQRTDIFGIPGNPRTINVTYHYNCL